MEIGEVEKMEQTVLQKAEAKLLEAKKKLQEAQTAVENAEDVLKGARKQGQGEVKKTDLKNTEGAAIKKAEEKLEAAKAKLMEAQKAVSDAESHLKAAKKA